MKLKKIRKLHFHHISLTTYNTEERLQKY